MSNSQTLANITRGSVALLAIAALLFTFRLPLASELSGASRGALAQEAALILDPGNLHARLSLANSAFAKRDYTRTLHELNHVSGSFEGLILQAKAEIEQGNDVEAIASAKTAHALAPADATATELLAIGYALTKQSAPLGALAASEGSAEAAERVLRTNGSNLALAQELYALGLDKRSQQILALPDAQSAERSLLSAKVILSLGNNHQAQLSALAELKLAVALDPSRLDAQTLLVMVSQQTGDIALADQHQLLVNKLEAGKP